MAGKISRWNPDPLFHRHPTGCSQSSSPSSSSLSLSSPWSSSSSLSNNDVKRRSRPAAARRPSLISKLDSPQRWHHAPCYLLPLLLLLQLDELPTPVSSKPLPLVGRTNWTGVENSCCLYLLPRPDSPSIARGCNTGVTDVIKLARRATQSKRNTRKSAACFPRQVPCPHLVVGACLLPHPPPRPPKHIIGRSTSIRNYTNNDIIPIFCSSSNNNINNNKCHKDVNFCSRRLSCTKTVAYKLHESELHSDYRPSTNCKYGSSERTVRRSTDISSSLSYSNCNSLHAMDRFNYIRQWLFVDI